MPRVSNNAEAPYVVLVWDGNLPGVTNGYDTQAEAKAEADTINKTSPDHVKAYALTQDGLVDKVAELTGTDKAALTDTNQAVSPEREQAAKP